KGDWVDQPHVEETQHFYYYLSSSVGPGDRNDIMTSYGKYIIIEMFEYRCNGGVYPTLVIDPNQEGSNYNNSILHVLSSGGRGNPTPVYLKDNGSTWLDVVSDNQDGWFKVVLKKP